MIEFVSSYIALVRNVGIGILVFVAAISVNNLYFQTDSGRKNAEADLTARPLKGAYILTAPKTLVTGQKISRKEIVNYLKEVGFSDVTKLQPTGELPVGCFRVVAEENQLQLRSLVDDHLYPPLAIEWNGKNEIVRLISDDGETLSAEIEGFGFNNAIYSLEEKEEQSVLKNFPVVRIPTRINALRDKPIYFVAQASEGSFDKPVSPKGLLGSAYRNYIESPIKDALGYETGNNTGGSTPAMQICRNAILHDKRDTFLRKIREIYCASDLSTRLSEPEIAEIFFNHIYFGFWRGEHLYGIETAAQRIFGKSAADLNIKEAAWICALAPTPARLRKLASGDEKTLAKHSARVNAILDRASERYADRFAPQQIEEAKAKTVKFSDVKTVSRQTRFDRVAKPFMQMAHQEFPPLKRELNPDTLTVSAGQLSDAVYQTRLEPEIMFAAERILKKRLKEIRTAFPPVNDKAKPVNDALVGVVSLTDPKTGEVIALVVSTTDPDRETSAIYANALIDPGSQKKTFDISAALEAGLITPATRIDPSKGRIIEKCNGKEWRPRMGVGGVKTVADVLSKSDDGGIVVIVDLLGLEESITFYERMTDSRVKHLETNSGCRQYASVNAIGFGDMDASPLRMNEGLSPFANLGLKSKNRFLSNVHFNGNLESQPSLFVPDQEQIISPQTAYLMMWMMRRVLTQGTAAKLPFSEYLRKNPATAIGCKTGSGGMSVGFSCAAPNFTASVQVFYADGSRFRQSGKNQIFAADTSAKIFSDLMMETLKIKPQLLKGELPRPEGIVEVKVDLTRGCRSESGELVPFRTGTEPKFCSEANQEAERVFVVDTNDNFGLNLRESKDIKSTVIGFAPEGAQVDLLFCEDEQVIVNGQRGAWCRVSYGESEGWGWGWFLREIHE